MTSSTPSAAGCPTASEVTVSLEQTMVRLCEAYVSGGAFAPPAPDDEPNWLALARRHRLTPLAWGILAHDGRLSASLREALRSDFYRSVLRHAELAERAAALLRALSVAGVPAILLKGAAVGPRLYRHPAHRPMADVDLLVRPANVPAAVTIAAGQGLRPFADRPLEFVLRYAHATLLLPHPANPARPGVDLHWHLVEDRTAARRAEAWLDACWRRAVPAELGGAPALALAGGDLLLHLAAHLVLHHALDGLLWRCDLALLAATLSRAEVDAAVDTAVEHGLLGTLALALMIPPQLGVPVPRDGRLTPPAWRPRWRLARRLARRALARDAAATPLAYVLPLLVADRLRDALRALRGRLVPPPEWIRARYGTGLVHGYARHLRAAVAVLARGREADTSA